MSANLLSLRLVVVSDLVEDHELFRQAAASAVTPIEIVTVGSAAAARGKLAGADLLYLDDGLSGDEIKRDRRRGARDAQSAIYRAAERASPCRRAV